MANCPIGGHLSATDDDGDGDGDDDDVHFADNARMTTVCPLHHYRFATRCLTFELFKVDFLAIR